MSATSEVDRGETARGPGSSPPAQVGAMRPAARRNAGLDALRAALTLLVLFHHTAITYGAIGGWYYHEAEPDSAPGTQLLIFFCTVNQAFFMGLFFLIAGFPDAGRPRAQRRMGLLKGKGAAARRSHLGVLPFHRPPGDRAGDER